MLAPAVIYSPAIEIVRVVGENDEAMTSAAYGLDFRRNLKRLLVSSYWIKKARFSTVRKQLEAAASLTRDWDSQGAEPPNMEAYELATKILALLEATSMPPTRLMPTVEGGIAISFVENLNRAVVEIYNNGEIAAATYSDQGDPIVWELESSETALLDSLSQIRVHLAT
jgi:hypothetical protein